MKRAIFIRFLLPLLTAIVICGSFSILAVNQNAENVLERDISNTLSMCARVYDFEGDLNQTARDMSQDCYGYRITIIAENGTVLGDSQADARLMDDHSDRIEFEKSQEDGQYSARRYSDTMKVQMLYVAQKVDEGTVIRASVPLTMVHELIVNQLPILLIGILAAILFALILAYRLTNTLLRPLSSISDGIGRIEQGDYEYRLPLQKYQELNSMVTLINTLSKSISKSLTTIEEEKQKLEFLLDAIRQGIILVDEEMNIVQVNRSAKLILNHGAEIKKQPLLYLTRSPQIISAAEACLKSRKSSIFDLEDEEKGLIYSVSVGAADGKWISGGAIIVLTDVTAARDSEKIRREFVANASHELKTPVTSIRGFADLLASGLVKDPKQADDYIRRIQLEAERMTNLISDILRLSSLEEGKQIRKVEPVRADDVVDDVVKASAQYTREKGIRVSADTDGSVLWIDRDDLFRLLSNLVINAIKYNRPGGSVQIHVKRKGQVCTFKVSDTGIGIPEKDMTRVFERFYTVDKGRSASVGGTGLGLSIVKHLVAYYEGEITIKSREGEGTVITVKLPLKPAVNE